jgi:outer membrane lipoprotein SlyB
VRQVKIEGTDSMVGAIAGGAIGGVAGHSVGEGNGKDVATVVGVIAGALAGKAAEEELTKEDGVEITVKLDSGELVAVVQEATEEFHPGEKVRLLDDGGVTRVSH